MTVKTTSLGHAVENAAYSKTLAATGGTPPYSWAVTGGSPPAGLSLSPSGVLGGTPTTSGTFTFTVTATDSTATPRSGSASFTLTVKP